MKNDLDERDGGNEQAEGAPAAFRRRGLWVVALAGAVILAGVGTDIGRAGGRKAGERRPAAVAAVRARAEAGPSGARRGESGGAVSVPESVTPASMLQDTKTVSLVVKRGESVEAIAWRMLPETAYMTDGELAAGIRSRNRLEKGHPLQPGQTLQIPGVPVHPFLEKPQIVGRNFEARAIYLTGWTAGSLYGMKLIEQWKKAGGNAVVFDIKDFDGQVRVPFHNAYASQHQITIRNLPKFIA